MENEQMINRDGTYFLQLPYLNSDQNPRVVSISSFDAEMLKNAKTHNIIHSDGNCYVVYPIVEPTPNIKYQH
jgi:hypothetical protein